ncbi:MAG: peptidylprolyl isomerase [Acidobacteriota bacterium]
MKKSTIVFSLAVLLLPSAVLAQLPITTQITILRAEDARRYDKTLEDLLKSPSEDVRTRAALAAGRIGNENAVPALVSLLEKDQSAQVQEMAAFALGEIESISAADRIITSLTEYESTRAVLTVSRTRNGELWTSTNLTARLVEAAGKVAAANAGHAKTDELRGAILSVLKNQHERASRQQDRETVSLALTAALRAAPRDAKRVRPDDTDALVGKFLTNPDARVRADAANTLARLGAKNANTELRKMLSSDADPVARATAARALGAAEDGAALDVLIKAATSDVDLRVRVSSIRSLAALKNQKAAGPLLKRGETLLAAYKIAKKPDSVPSEQNEFIEVVTALGRLLANTQNERAITLLREFGKLDNGFSTGAYIARVRISPVRGEENAKPELTHWRQYSTLAQVVGEFATLEPTNEEGKKMKGEALEVLHPLAMALAEADPVSEASTIMAAADVIRAYAGFKTPELPVLLLTALESTDLFTRAAAAELLGDLPPTPEISDALAAAFRAALLTDKHDNDAQLAILDALFKLDKAATLAVMPDALAAVDYLVRRRAITFLEDAQAWKDASEDEVRKLKALGAAKDLVTNYDAKSGTKLGQVLNTGADYRRAIARKNGTVKAVLATEKGNFTIDLLPEDAPLTVDNFIKLARANYFNGLEVHRVVPNFVMQDGDPRGDGNGGPGWSIRCEINMVPYERGAVGMALSGKDTGGSQWFVTHSPQPHLDGGYTVFGRVNERDMKVVDNIVRGDKISSVRIIEGVSTRRTLRTQSKK